MQGFANVDTFWNASENFGNSASTSLGFGHASSCSIFLVAAQLKMTVFRNIIWCPTVISDKPGHDSHSDILSSTGWDFWCHPLMCFVLRITVALFLTSPWNLKQHLDHTLFTWLYSEEMTIPWPAGQYDEIFASRNAISRCSFCCIEKRGTSFKPPNNLPI